MSMSDVQRCLIIKGILESLASQIKVYIMGLGPEVDYPELSIENKKEREVPDNEAGHS